MTLPQMFVIASLWALVASKCIGPYHTQKSRYVLKSDESDSNSHESIACAFQCNQDDSCNGFLVNNNSCQLQKNNSECSNADSQCYTRPKCIRKDPYNVSMRQGSVTKHLHVIYQTNETLGTDDKMPNDANIINRLLQCIPYGSGRKKFLQMIDRIMMDFYYIKDDGLYIYVLYEDDTLDIIRYQNKGWERITEPRTFSEEYSPNPPSCVNAADLNQESHEFFAISGNFVYHYNVTGRPPALSYW